MHYLNELEDAISDILTKHTEYESNNIIVSYNNLGFPLVNKDTDALYFYINPEENDISNFINRSYYEDGKIIAQNTEVFTIHFSAYGLNSVDRMRKLLLDWYSFPVKEKLSKVELYTMPDQNRGPLRLMENYNGQWWQRCELVVSVYCTNSNEHEVGYYDKYNVIIKESR